MRREGEESGERKKGGKRGEEGEMEGEREWTESEIDIIIRYYNLTDKTTSICGCGGGRG